MITWTDIVIVIISASAVFVALRSFWVSKKSLRHQTFAELQKEYRSPQIGLAISKLWSLYIYECNKNMDEMVRRYIEDWKDKRCSGGTIDDLNNYLYLQRRIVTQFYHSLSNLYFNHVIPSDLVFEVWNSEALEIIPKILIPIENAIRGESGRKPLDESYSLYRFYDAAVKYEKKKK